MFAIENKEAFKKAVYRENAAKLSTFIYCIDSKPDKFITVPQPFVPRSRPSVKMIKQPAKAEAATQHFTLSGGGKKGPPILSKQSKQGVIYLANFSSLQNTHITRFWQALKVISQPGYRKKYIDNVFSSTGDTAMCELLEDLILKTLKCL